MKRQKDYGRVRYCLMLDGAYDVVDLCSCMFFMLCRHTPRCDSCIAEQPVKELGLLASTQSNEKDMTGFNGVAREALQLELIHPPTFLTSKACMHAALPDMALIHSSDGLF